MSSNKHALSISNVKMILGLSFVEKSHEEERAHNEPRYLRHHNLASTIISPFFFMAFLDQKGS